jgi:hypothetical protein
VKVSKAQLKRLSAAGITRPTLLGTWNNELGSVMNITTSDGTVFSGDYKSKDASNNWVSGSLQGTIAGDTIAFTVNWPSPDNSVTAWAGKLSADTSNSNKIYINTLWLLASGDATTPLWESISAGSDWFWQ